MRPAAIFSILLVVTPAALGVATSTAPSNDLGGTGVEAPCEDPTFVDGQGLSCRLKDSSWTVQVHDGLWMRTHGPDPVLNKDTSGATGSPDSWLSDRASPQDATCVGPPQVESHVRVVYAYSEFEEDRFEQFLEDLRDTVRRANGMLHHAAMAEHDAFRSLKIACNEDGRILVEKLELSTRKDETTWGSVVDDAIDEDYADLHTKYWIFVDPNSEQSRWGGFSSLPHDSSDSVNNRNNLGLTYSVLLGSLNEATWLHELMHAMGAVQGDAPNFYDNFGGWHCRDNYDVMCYGPETFTRCSSEHLDCGHDDYFDPDPEPGTYLDSHWNVASEKNRFIATTPGCQGTLQVQASDRSDACQVAAGPDDASASYVAVSGTGDATGLIAASGLGTADGFLAASGTNDCEDGGSCVDAGTESAEASTLAVSSDGSEGALAVSAFGDSHGQLAAVSLLGSSSGPIAVSPTGEATGARAVSLFGDAESCYSIVNCLAVTGTGQARGDHAVSGTGPANGYTTSASGSGDASTEPHWTSTPLVDVRVPTSFSGTGHASGGAVSVSGCETVQNETGSGIACQDVDPDP